MRGATLWRGVHGGKIEPEPLSDVGELPAVDATFLAQDCDWSRREATARPNRWQGGWFPRLVSPPAAVIPEVILHIPGPLHPAHTAHTPVQSCKAPC